MIADILVHRYDAHKIVRIQYNIILLCFIYFYFMNVSYSMYTLININAMQMFHLQSQADVNLGIEINK